MINTSKIIKDAQTASLAEFGRPLASSGVHEKHYCLSKAIMAAAAPVWTKSMNRHRSVKRAYYFSAEFLMGRAIFNNLLNLNLTDKLSKELSELGINLSEFEEIEDAALGNGGLGRLAACFLESAATHNYPVDGYGIRYKYGLFKQKIENGFQKETADDWAKYGDGWSVKRPERTVKVKMGKMTVSALPYDMPVIGYAGKHISTLRLWEAHPTEDFDFDLFNRQEYDKSVENKNRCEDISRVLYPNDSTKKGRQLRLRQQYFFCSASLQDIISDYGDIKSLAEKCVIQLNDTHPAISIPEFIRLALKEGMEFEQAAKLAQKTFNYTNHTVMQEAMEKWELELINELSPEISGIIKKLDAMLRKQDGVKPDMHIISNGMVNMANMSAYMSRYINGVAKLHTEILKKRVLKSFYDFDPKKFQNKTNGITQRRWLLLCNRQLSGLISKLLGSDSFATDLSRLSELTKYASDPDVIKKFIEIKQEKKNELAEYIKQKENIEIDPSWVFDVQIKRLHEYKRQLLNILSVLELYYEIKEGSLNDFNPTVFIFGAKAAPGYRRAKAVIKLINETAKLIEQDETVSKYLKVVFVSNYNVSYAEKIVAAADISEQISAAGTEASGTGNMKLMLNGAVTFGTYDGANIEIVNEAGEENNYIFGAKAEELSEIYDEYDPAEFYERDRRIKRIIDSLDNGTLDDCQTGMFKELKDSLLLSTPYEKADRYFLFYDFDSYHKTRLKLNRDTTDKETFAKKCWLNIASAGKFSSDRTIAEYAKEIWKIKKI